MSLIGLFQPVMIPLQGVERDKYRNMDYCFRKRNFLTFWKGVRKKLIVFLFRCAAHFLYEVRKVFHCMCLHSFVEIVPCGRCTGKNGNLRGAYRGVMRAFSQSSSGSSGNREIVLQVDGRELGRATIKNINGLQRAAGTSLITY